MNPKDSQLQQLGIRDRDYKDTPGNAEIERLIAKLDTFRNGKYKQSVLITSAVIGEGKSTISTRIARAFSRNWKNPTLLIDFDLRRPTLHQIFRVNKARGVAEILSNQLPFRFCIKNTYDHNLKILTSGNLENSPLEVFNIEKLKEFFAEAHNYFDYIIVDSPPIIPVSDPLVLGKVVDKVIVVVKAGETSKRVVKRAIDMMINVEVEICGIILNNMNSVLPYYYDHKYYGYHYYDYDKGGTESVQG